jgi:hypothetical protein
VGRQYWIDCNQISWGRERFPKVSYHGIGTYSLFTCSIATCLETPWMCSVIWPFQITSTLLPWLSWELIFTCLEYCESLIIFYHFVMQISNIHQLPGNTLLLPKSFNTFPSLSTNKTVQTSQQDLEEHLQPGPSLIVILSLMCASGAHPSLVSVPLCACGHTHTHTHTHTHAHTTLSTWKICPHFCAL